MKKLLGLLVLGLVVFVAGCAGPSLTPQQTQIRAVSNVDACDFVTSAYLESRPQVLQHYLKIQTDRRGGNAYKVISTSSTVVMGGDVVMANYEVYRCEPRQ